MTINAGFTLKSLSFKLKDLTFMYDKAKDYYKLYGEASAKIEGDDVDVLLGNANNPGIVFQNGEIDHINMGITADFKLKSLNIDPDSLSFEYDKSSTEKIYKIYGGLNLNLDGKIVDANFGNENNPGLTLTNGSIEELNLSSHR